MGNGYTSSVYQMGNGYTSNKTAWVMGVRPPLPILLVIRVKTVKTTRLKMRRLSSKVYGLRLHSEQCNGLPGAGEQAGGKTVQLALAITTPQRPKLKPDRATVRLARAMKKVLTFSKAVKAK